MNLTYRVMGVYVSIRRPLVLFHYRPGFVRPTRLGSIWKNILFTGKGKDVM